MSEDLDALFEDSPTPEDLDAEFEAAPPAEAKRGRAEAFIRGAMQAASFGTADDAVDALEARGFPRTDVLTAEQRVARAARDRPIAYGAGEVLGGIGAGIATRGFFPRGLPGAVAQGGAMVGARSAEEARGDDAKDIGLEAARGALVGGAGGALGYGLAAGAGKALDYLRRGAKPMARAVRSHGKVLSAQEKLAEARRANQVARGRAGQLTQKARSATEQHPLRPKIDAMKDEIARLEKAASQRGVDLPSAREALKTDMSGTAAGRGADASVRAYVNKVKALERLIRSRRADTRTPWSKAGYAKMDAKQAGEAVKTAHGNVEKWSEFREGIPGGGSMKVLQRGGGLWGGLGAAATGGAPALVMRGAIRRAASNPETAKEIAAQLMRISRTQGLGQHGKLIEALASTGGAAAALQYHLEALDDPTYQKALLDALKSE